jgi:hypothetical protein
MEWEETEKQLLGVLREAGLKASSDESNARMAASEASGMDRGGPYKVLHTLKGKGVTVVVEQNTGSEPGPYGDMTVPYPPTVIVESDKGRGAASPADTEAVLTLVRQLGQG